MLQIQSTEFVVVLQVDHVRLPNTVGPWSTHRIIYSINRHGRLSNFGTSRVGAYSRFDP